MDSKKEETKKNQTKKQQLNMKIFYKNKTPASPAWDGWAREPAYREPNFHCHQAWTPL